MSARGIVSTGLRSTAFSPALSMAARPCETVLVQFQIIMPINNGSEIQTEPLPQCRTWMSRSSHRRLFSLPLLLIVTPNNHAQSRVDYKAEHGDSAPNSC